jgi:hypothetical protein
LACNAFSTLPGGTIGTIVGSSVWSLYHGTGLDQDIIAVWLQNAGYRTAQLAST